MEMLSAGTLSSTATDKPEGTDVNWNFLFEKKGVTGENKIHAIIPCSLNVCNCTNTRPRSPQPQP